MSLEEAPWKRCAICEREIPWRWKLCIACSRQWDRALANKEPWMIALIELARKDFNLRRQIFRYERSLEELEERKQITKEEEQ